MKIPVRYLFRGSLLLFIILTLGLLVAQAQGTPRTRFVHTSPDAPNLDIYVDSNLALEGLPYRTVSGYSNIEPGDHELRMYPTGVSVDTAPILVVTYPFNNTVDYSVVVIGRLGAIEGRQLIDDNSSLPAGKTRVRIMHAVPDGPAVDICITGSNTCLANNLTFGNNSDYSILDAGAYSFDVRLTGTDQIAFTQAGLNFVDGVAYTLYAIGIVNGAPGLELIAATGTGRPPPQPPPTGAFLTPTLVFIVTIILLLLIGGSWFTWRQFRRYRKHPR